MRGGQTANNSPLALITIKGFKSIRELQSHSDTVC